MFSKAGIVNELNITQPEKPPGAPILVPGAKATSTVIQAAAGFVNLFGGD